MSSESNAPDLTAAEARAELEAWFGEGWTCDGSRHHDGDAVVWAQRCGCHQYGMASTFRAAVDALKAAWRDAVRPWVQDGIIRYETHRCEHTPEEVTARVLGEES